MKVDFKIDASKLTSITKGELAKQARFASAQTLTQAAFDSRARVQRYLPIWLHLKTRFLQRSLVVNRATPKKLKAVVGFLPRASIMPWLETGGWRRPHNTRGNRAIAIPVDVRNKMGRITRGRTARMILQRPNTISAEINGIAGIWQRNPRTNKIKLLYAYKPKTHYEQKMIRFERTVELHAPRFVRDHMWENLVRAIDTRKK